MRALLAAAVILLLTALPAAATDVGVADLEGDPQLWSGRTVTIRGELVGDYSVRSGGVIWVQLNDDAYAIRPMLERQEPAGTNLGMGVRMGPDLFRPEEWGDPGRFRVRGPLVAVTGIFVYNDPTSGDTFVDASAIALLEPSRRLEEQVSPGTWLLSASVLAAGMVAGGFALARRRRLEP
jgi:hypothetical protein